MISVSQIAVATPLLCVWKHFWNLWRGAYVSFRPPTPLIFTTYPLHWHMYVFKTTQEIVPHMEIKCYVVVWSDDVVDSLGEAESTGSELHTCSLHVQMERKKERKQNWCRTAGAGYTTGGFHQYFFCFSLWSSTDEFNLCWATLAICWENHSKW